MLQFDTHPDHAPHGSHAAAGLEGHTGCIMPPSGIGYTDQETQE